MRTGIVFLTSLREAGITSIPGGGIELRPLMSAAASLLEGHQEGRTLDPQWSLCLGYAGFS